MIIKLIRPLMRDQPPIKHINVAKFAIIQDNIFIKTRRGSQISYNNAKCFEIDIEEPKKY